MSRSAQPGWGNSVSAAQLALSPDVLPAQGQGTAPSASMADLAAEAALAVTFSEPEQPAASRRFDRGSDEGEVSEKTRDLLRSLGY